MQHTARHRSTLDDLQTVVDHWPHLRALLDTSQAIADTWPPAMGRAEYLRALDQEDAAEVSSSREIAAALAHALAHPQRLVTRHDEHGRPRYECEFCDRTGDGGAHPVREDRSPAQLGERPVPIRLHVADACRAIEIALCGLADAIASRDAVDPADWHGRDRAQRTAPNAARWLMTRVTGTPCCSAHGGEQGRIARFAREAADRLDRVVGLQRAAAVLPGMPCPWCGGDLVAHTEGETIVRVTCGTGLIDCDAPAAFDVDRRARVWSTAEEIAELYRAVNEAGRRRRRTEARARQRAAARAKAA